MSRERKYRFSVVLILISGFIFSACVSVKPVYYSDDEKRAEKVVEQFHKLYNEQNYEEIFNTAHEEAKRTKSREGLGLALAQAFEKYGRHLSSEIVYRKVQPVSGSERQVEFALRSKFEKGERIETFLIVSNGEKAALFGIGELTEEELEKLDPK